MYLKMEMRFNRPLDVDDYVVVGGLTVENNGYTDINFENQEMTGGEDDTLEVTLYNLSEDIDERKVIRAVQHIQSLYDCHISSLNDLKITELLSMSFLINDTTFKVPNRVINKFNREVLAS